VTKQAEKPESDSSSGQFAGLVRTAGAIMSASFAIAFAWRRRSRWEPSEQDVDNGAERVAGLLTGLFIVLLWVRFSTPEFKNPLTDVAIALGVITLLMLILYGYLVSNQTYYVLKNDQGEPIPRRNIIAGFRLTEYATHESKPPEAGQPPVTLQAVLEKVDFKPDLVWPRGSRSAAKAVFVICYILLVVCGSVALASAAVVGSLLVPGATQNAPTQNNSPPSRSSDNTQIPTGMRFDSVGSEQLENSVQPLDRENRSEANGEKSIATVVKMNWESLATASNQATYCLQIQPLGDYVIRGFAAVNDASEHPQSRRVLGKRNDDGTLDFRLPTSRNEAYVFLRFQQSDGTIPNFSIDLKSLIRATPNPSSSCG
jgi:hypothetical protein